MCFLSDSTDSSCVWYYGDSYLKFQNVFLNQQNNISLEFQTSKSSGLLLYIKQDSDSVDAFFTQLYIENGTLKVSHLINLIDFLIKWLLLSEILI